jgi:hypothetical protein
MQLLLKSKFFESRSLQEVVGGLNPVGIAEGEKR